jgi:basic membrane protein A
MPGTIITSMIKRGDIAVFDVVRSVVDHRFEGGMRTFGLAEDGVDWVHDGPHASAIPDDVKARVAELRAAVTAKQIRVPSR